MKKTNILLLIFTVSVLSACSSFLDEKSDKKLVSPTRLADLQALLDNDGVLNAGDPGEGEISSDDYYLRYETWQGLSNEYDRRAYTWEPDYTTTSTSWFSAYRYVYYANIILEHLDRTKNIASSLQTEWNNIAGQAYYLRARGHLALQLIWSLAYDEHTADSDLGVPLRLSADFNRKSVRSTSTKVYERIISDLEKAAAFLPDNPNHVLRASRPAAYGLLARTYLFMRDYEKCYQYADSCLQLKKTLINYNDLDTSLAFPFPIFNSEVIHHALVRSTPQPLQQARSLIDSNLYALYEEGDLRKVIFFKDNGDGTHSFKGSYSGDQNLFSGIAVDEVYLMRAECSARMGNLETALMDLNYLLSHRYKAGTFIETKTDNMDEVLRTILSERRKQLLFRTLRFPDVKRLNKEGANIEFRRKLNGLDYILPPNDPRFALWISEGVLERAKEIQQNER